jgi:hypothetical protein
MASNIEVTADANDGVTVPDIRDEFQSGLDVSQSSPITETALEVALVVDDGEVLARVEGHDGDFTKKSQEALKSALNAVDGVSGASVDAGGYEG